MIEAEQLLLLLFASVIIQINVFEILHHRVITKQKSLASRLKKL